MGDRLPLKQRKRPDNESISRHILTKRGLAMAATLNTIDNMLESGKIYNKKTANGEDSSFVSEGAIAKDDAGRECGNQLHSTQVRRVGSVLEDPIHSIHTEQHELARHGPAYRRLGITPIGKLPIVNQLD